MRIQLSANKCRVDHKDSIKKKVSATIGFTCLLGALFFLPVTSWAACTGSSPTWNSTADYASVNSCLGNATAGDTINVSGNATWTSTLNITKSIYLIAAKGSTTITRGSGLGSFININPSTNVPIRVSGFTFSNASMGVSGQNGITVTGGTRLKQLVIDNNTFIKGYAAIWLYRDTYGVISHNRFENCYFAARFNGDEANSWTDPIAAGTANAIFFEDNTVYGDNNATTGDHLQIYVQSGARVVLRYNDFDFRLRTNYDCFLIDTHGNQGYYRNGAYEGGGPWRGSPIIEIYNNTFRIHHGNWGEFRGGSIIAFNNTFSYISSQENRPFELWEEEGWQQCGSWFSPCRTEWPAQDQVTNSFFWNNTLNGASITDVSLVRSADAIFIQKDRDYFMHAPQSSGGKSTYSGRLGGSQAPPTQSDTGNMTFSNSANAYYSYISYTYPHPLIGSAADAKKPSAPTNLQLF